MLAGEAKVELSGRLVCDHRHTMVCSSTDLFKASKLELFTLRGIGFKY